MPLIWAAPSRVASFTVTCILYLLSAKQPLCVPVPHGDHVAEHAAALGGQLHIPVITAEEPFFIGQLHQDLIQKLVQLVGLAAGQHRKIQESAWRVVGEHIIHLIAAGFQVLLAGRIFFIGGHLLFPPVHARLPFLPVRAFGPAEAQVLFALQLQHAAAALYFKLNCPIKKEVFLNVQKHFLF